MSRRLQILLGLTLICAGTVSGQALSIRIGTLGPGMQLAIPVSGKIDIRAGASFFSYSDSRIVSGTDIDIDLDASITWGGVSALADYHPFGNSFRVSGGLVYNLINVSGSGLSVDSYFVDDKEFTPEKVGTLSVSGRTGTRLSPYAGIGLGRAVPRGRISFLLDVGALYTGTPRVEMSGTGLIAPTAGFGARLTEGLESFQWFPVVSAGLAFRL